MLKKALFYCCDTLIFNFKQKKKRDANLRQGVRTDFTERRENKSILFAI